ncbi:MAG: hypothetical protein DMF90_25720 [Acidobacteria bacterium]|nr:MAG: hypothetical protein DMF90_25720 [Acidobacteriota bacterium]
MCTRERTGTSARLTTWITAARTTRSARRSCCSCICISSDQLSAISSQRSALSEQLSAISPRRSALGEQLSAIS